MTLRFLSILTFILSAGHTLQLDQKNERFILHVEDDQYFVAEIFPTPSQQRNTWFEEFVNSQWEKSQKARVNDPINPRLLNRQHIGRNHCAGGINWQVDPSLLAMSQKDTVARLNHKSPEELERGNRLHDAASTLLTTVQSSMKAGQQGINNTFLFIYASTSPYLMPSTNSIEMSFSVMTSDHSPFATFLGLHRTIGYNGVNHNNLTIPMYQFAADCLGQFNFPVAKNTMVFPPLKNTQLIMDHYIPHGFGKAQYISIENAMYIEPGPLQLFVPHTPSNGTEEKPVNIHEMTFRDSTGGIHRISRSDPNYLWFFDNPAISHPSFPLFIVDLAQLKKANPSEYLHHKTKRQIAKRLISELGIKNLDDAIITRMAYLNEQQRDKLFLAIQSLRGGRYKSVLPTILASYLDINKEFWTPEFSKFLELFSAFNCKTITTELASLYADYKSNPNFIDKVKDFANQFNHHEQTVLRSIITYKNNHWVFDEANFPRYLEITPIPADLAEYWLKKKLDTDFYYKVKNLIPDLQKFTLAQLNITETWMDKFSILFNELNIEQNKRAKLLVDLIETVISLGPDHLKGGILDFIIHKLKTREHQKVMILLSNLKHIPARIIENHKFVQLLDDMTDIIDENSFICQMALCYRQGHNIISSHIFSPDLPNYVRTLKETFGTENVCYGLAIAQRKWDFYLQEVSWLKPTLDHYNEAQDKGKQESIEYFLRVLPTLELLKETSSDYENRKSFIKELGLAMGKNKFVDKLFEHFEVFNDPDLVKTGISNFIFKLETLFSDPRSYSRIVYLTRQTSNKLRLTDTTTISSFIQFLSQYNEDDLSGDILNFMIHEINKRESVNDDQLQSIMQAIKDHLNKKTPDKQRDFLKEQLENSQSTHRNETHKSTAQSAQKLHARYKGTLPDGDIVEHFKELIEMYTQDNTIPYTESLERLSNIFDATVLNQFIHTSPYDRTQNGQDTVLNQTAQRLISQAPDATADILCVSRYLYRKKAANYVAKYLKRISSSDFIEQISGFKLSHVLKLLYCAITDTSWGDGDKDIPSRVINFTDQLIRIANEYGEQSASCPSGTFNGLIEYLSFVHPDVKVITDVKAYLQNLSPDLSDTDYESQIENLFLYLGEASRNDPQVAQAIRDHRAARMELEDLENQAYIAYETELRKLSQLSHDDFERQALELARDFRPDQAMFWKSIRAKVRQEQNRPTPQ